MQDNMKDVMGKQVLDSTQPIDDQQSQKEIKIKLDYSIEDPKERVKLVNKIVENIPPEEISSRYLEVLADYLVFAMNKKEKKERLINTDNRMYTINKRQTSYEGLVTKFENGEDGVYNLIINDKNVLLTKKYKITQEDLIEIPELKKLKDAIEVVEEQQKKAKGKRKFLLKKQIIEMRRDQYIIKNAYKPAIYCINLIKTMPYLDLSDHFDINEDKNIINNGLISLLNPTHISLLLCNYSKLKMQSWDKIQSDIYYLMQDLQNAADAALKEQYPLYYDLMIYKIDGKSNLQIQKLLKEKYGITHSVEYLSSLWRKKIPKLIAEEEEKRTLVWYYTEKKKGKWKKCSRCGQIKLAHNKFFSKNGTSKDGFYSLCKECRNKKNKENKK